LVTPEEIEDLIDDCPVLYHMAMRDSWPSIQRLGLIPTDALLKHFEVDSDLRHQLTSGRRAATVEITHAELGTAFVRDQIPLLDSDLSVCLRDGLTPLDWHKRLNERVFFWLTPQRLQTMLCAGAYRKLEHLVLQVRTRDIVERYRQAIELSPMNSGATRPWRHPRGANTFLPISAYPYADRKKVKPRGERVVELTVIGGVPDIADYVLEAGIVSCAGKGEVLFKRD
jgi:hypothetical protein